jgi:hypothetical protein
MGSSSCGGNLRQAPLKITHQVIEAWQNIFATYGLDAILFDRPKTNWYADWRSRLDKIVGPHSLEKLDEYTVRIYQTEATDPKLAHVFDPYEVILTFAEHVEIIAIKKTLWDHLRDD